MNNMNITNEELEMSKLLSGLNHLSKEQKYIAGIKAIFKAKYDEFTFDGDNYFVFKQLIPDISDENEQYYIQIRKKAHIYADILYETTYRGEKISKECYSRSYKNVRFWTDNIRSLYEYKLNISPKIKQPDITMIKEQIIEKLLKEKTGMDISLQWRHTTLKIENDKAEYVMNNSRIHELMIELKKELDLFDIVKKV